MAGVEINPIWKRALMKPTLTRIRKRKGWNNYDNEIGAAKMNLSLKTS
jgi:hypothetical protein